jgi:hypothetical protein
MDSQSTWSWSSGANDPNGSANAQDASTHQSDQPQASSQAGQSSSARPNRRTYGPRSCRICLETEQPKFPTDTSTTFGIASTSSRPTYESDDPELGRLLSPCKCKGSQKYVHEGCLNAWRLANPNATRNYWQCPTCKYTYRMARLHWAAALSSKVTQIALTVVLLVISIFVLGFIADPLFDLWFDPVGTVTETLASVVNDIEALREPDWEPPMTWSEHFAKGFFSLGLVGLVKTMFGMAPWHWFNMRAYGIGGGRRGGTGRARAENMSWIFILIGAVTFLMAIWRFVGALSARVLKNVSDSVLDIDEDTGDDQDADDGVGADEHSKDR